MVKKNTKLGLFALLVVIILGIALTVYFSGLVISSQTRRLVSNVNKQNLSEIKIV